MFYHFTTFAKVIKFMEYLHFLLHYEFVSNSFWLTHYIFCLIPLPFFLLLFYLISPPSILSSNLHNLKF